MNTHPNRDLVVGKNSRDSPRKIDFKSSDSPLIRSPKKYHPSPSQIIAARSTHGNRYGVWMSSLFVALLALPAPLQMVQNINYKNMIQIEREPAHFIPVEPQEQLEQTIPKIPIHPLNIDPKRILGDQFVEKVEVIEKRAIAINSIFDRVDRF